MNTKIKIYCGIITLIYVGIIISHLSSSLDIFTKGLEYGKDSAQKNTSFHVYHFKLVPEQGVYVFPEKLTNSLTGEEMNAEVGEYKVMMNELPQGGDSTKESILSILKMVISLIFAGLVIYLPFLFFRIVKTTVKGDLIEGKVIKNITKMGIVLLCMFVIETLVAAMDVFSIRNMVQIDGYNIVMGFTDYMLLILGVVTLLLAEVLKVSLKLKEEQELTI